jgi:hypothetical protein
MARPCRSGDTLPLSLDPTHLPYRLERIPLRVFLALAAWRAYCCHRRSCRIAQTSVPVTRPSSMSA